MTTVTRHYVTPNTNLLTDPAGVLRAAHASLVRHATAQRLRIDPTRVTVQARPFGTSGGVDCTILWLEAPTIDPDNAFLATELALGADRTRAALDAFVAVNPHLAGIRWADVLDNLINYDAMLHVTEAYDPIPEVHGRYQACAAISLYWVTGGRRAPDLSEIADLARAAQALTRDDVLAWVRAGGWPT